MKGRIAATLILAVLVMPACGPQASSSARPNTTPIGSATNATPTGAGSKKVTGLSVQFSSGPGESAGIHCPYWPDRQNQLTMASNRLAYDAGEIKQMAAAVSNRGIHYDAIPGNLLRLVGGVPTTAQLNLPVGITSRVKFAFACAAALEVTNTGHSAMQIAKAGVRLTRSPEQNQTTYRLIEACSIQRLDFYCGPQLGGGPVRCAIYTLQVKLESAPAGTEVTGVPMAIDDQTQKPCPLPTLEPNQSVEIWLDAYSPAALVYPVVPILVVNTVSGVQTAVLDDLVGNMSFADPSQFTCYRLVGNSLEAWKQGQEAVDWPTLGHQNAWCP